MPMSMARPETPLRPDEPSARALSIVDVFDEHVLDEVMQYCIPKASQRATDLRTRVLLALTPASRLAGVEDAMSELENEKVEAMMREEEESAAESDEDMDPVSPNTQGCVESFSRLDSNFFSSQYGPRSTIAIFGVLRRTRSLWPQGVRVWSQPHVPGVVQDVLKKGEENVVVCPHWLTGVERLYVMMDSNTTQYEERLRTQTQQQQQDQQQEQQQQEEQPQEQQQQDTTSRTSTPQSLDFLPQSHSCETTASSVSDLSMGHSSEGAMTPRSGGWDAELEMYSTPLSRRESAEKRRVQHMLLLRSASQSSDEPQPADPISAQDALASVGIDVHSWLTFSLPISTHNAITEHVQNETNTIGHIMRAFASRFRSLTTLECGRSVPGVSIDAILLHSPIERLRCATIEQSGRLCQRPHKLVTSLHLEDCSRLSTVSLCAVASQVPNLTTLTLDGIASANDDVVSSFFRFSKNLKTLTLTNLPAFRGRLCRTAAPSLTRIELLRCPRSLPQDVFTFVRCAPNLQSLYTRDPPGLTVACVLGLVEFATFHHLNCDLEGIEAIVPALRVFHPTTTVTSTECGFDLRWE